jgi:hypothetical protein
VESRRQNEATPKAGARKLRLERSSWLEVKERELAAFGIKTGLEALAGFASFKTRPARHVKFKPTAPAMAQKPREK